MYLLFLILPKHPLASDYSWLQISGYLRIFVPLLYVFVLLIIKSLIVCVLLAAPALTLFFQSRITNTGDIEDLIVAGTDTEVPGLSVTGWEMTGFSMVTGAAGPPSIRVLRANPVTRVLIPLDGQPQLMGIMGHRCCDAWDSSDAERADVKRVSASFPEWIKLLNQSFQVNCGYSVPGVNFRGGIRLRLFTY
jgi:hypothetical protein